ncbi:MAG: isoquinoline 1-oxidoreductase alpha subunit [Paracoccaceae bacterium]|jgi:isoquinoline 1-oxidoreductase alpha subunit
MKLTVNAEVHEIDADPEMPLLWALRDLLNVKGPKYGCGIAACGACTVWIDGVPTRSCVMPVGVVTGEITTIEGLPAAMPSSDPASVLSAVQHAWETEQVPQCGYCQSGQIMVAAALLRDAPAPTDADIDDAMTNLCRCGTYPRIRAAIHRAARQIAEG